ncbi:carbohydrate sulfotransferase 1-like isoform X2 [Ruditapes philippinarum]|uniref:carbohydrate sulfotransferase 1-like isoform X2 n=1 Tax=Ruditapes philippinarum TaxID=129788 RepID=UPI00295A5AA3|nr:carbohydrate sulfotransferase 1-like isoform X2 [Ruditapes philippinarum]
MYSRRFSNGIYNFNQRAGRRTSLRSKVIVLILVFLLTHLFLRYFFPSDERLYVYYNVDELKIEKSINNPTFALIVSYQRAGFALISGLLSHADESFYIPEPLQILLPHGYYKENMVCFENSTYRRPTSLAERYDFMITAIHRLFTCQCSKLHPLSKALLVKSTLTVYKKIIYKHCHSVHSASIPNCIEELEELCKSKSHRIITTERSSMENVIDMMEYWPNLKVVHIIRDPRGMVHSRLKVGQDFQLAFNLENHANELCSRMYEDVKFSWYMQRKFNDRISAVSYEAFVESPYSGTSFLYDFLNMLYTDKVWYRVYHSTHEKEEVGWSYNSTRVAYSWRTHLEFQTVKIIDHSCHDMYRVYGYDEMTSAAELQNQSVPTRHKVQFNLKGFL